MRSLVNELALSALREKGFNPQILPNGNVLIRGFKLLNKENSKEGIRHYSYPNGLIPGFEKIRIERSQDTRIQSITVPILPGYADIAHYQFMVGYFCQSDKVNVSEQNDAIKIELNGSTHSPKVIDYFIGEILEKEPADDSTTHNVSDIGRLFPFIRKYLITEIRKQLLNENGDISLLERLVDTDIEQQINLKLPKQLIQYYINNQCREAQLLVKLINKSLRLNEMLDFISTDIDGLRTPKVLSKIQECRERQGQFFIATTTGEHAFAMMIDFSKSSLFIANPAGKCENFDDIISVVREISGCSKIVWANSQRMERGILIDISDTCTADAYVLVDMMRRKHQEAQLSEDCLNNEVLRTGEIIWQSINKDDKRSITKEQLEQSLASYRPNTWLGIFCFIISFGYHRSETIKALDALCVRKEKNETVNFEEMKAQILASSDSRKTHRINLFSANEAPDYSGTDRVIQEILRMN
ncbi:MAG: hypothetical protein EBY16_03505 [Gammaproteobacteria bacterium]|nr:hypothetical protein [Gammaproteobacteria bacterium]